MIFYFTGTGNSLDAAKHLDTELISIPHIMNSELLNFETERKRQSPLSKCKYNAFGNHCRK